MDDEEVGLGDLGIADPDRPWPRPVIRMTFEDSLAILGRSAADDASDPPPRSPAPPPWVIRAKAWTPPQDLATRDVQVRYAIEPLIQAGLVGALVAAGGTSKTTLLLHLFCHVAIGRPWMGCAVKSGTCVLLSGDDSQDDLTTALALVVRAMKLTAAEIDLVQRKVRVISLQGLAGLRTFTAVDKGAAVATGVEDLILQAVEDIGDLVLIALDTLRQFSGGSSNDEQVIKLAIAGATEVAQATGASVILPHHTGKQNYRDGIADMYCGSGSAAIADNCRFVLLLQTTSWTDIADKVQRTGNERGTPLVLTSTRGSLLVRAPAPIFMYRDGFTFGRVAGAVLTADQVADEKDRAILWAVRKGAQTKTAIAVAVGGRKALALDRIDDLEERGHLENGSPTGSRTHPVFVLSASGASFIDADR